MTDRETMLELACEKRDGARYREDYYTSLWRLAADVPENGVIVEIGVAHGNSTIAMLCGADSSVTLVSVDPAYSSDGPFHYPDCNNPEGITIEANMGDLLRRILETRAATGGQLGQHHLLPYISEKALGMWRGGFFYNHPRNPLQREIDLLLVDGCHLYEAVQQDCLWMDYVRPGGFAVFDDWMAQVRQACLDHIATFPGGSWEFIHEGTNPPKGDLCVTLLKRNH